MGGLEWSGGYESNHGKRIDDMRIYEHNRAFGQGRSARNQDDELPGPNSETERERRDSSDGYLQADLYQPRAFLCHHQPHPGSERNCCSRERVAMISQATTPRPLTLLPPGFPP